MGAVCLFLSGCGFKRYQGYPISTPTLLRLQAQKASLPEVRQVLGEPLLTAFWNPRHLYYGYQIYCQKGPLQPRLEHHAFSVLIFDNQERLSQVVWTTKADVCRIKPLPFVRSGTSLFESRMAYAFGKMAHVPLWHKPSPIPDPVI